MLQVETPDVGAPQQAQVRCLPFGTVATAATARAALAASRRGAAAAPPPKPASRPRWAKVCGCPAFRAPSPSDAGSPRRARAPSPSRHPRIHARRRDRARCSRVLALRLGPVVVAARPSCVGRRRAGEARIGVEAATRSQPDEDLARIPLQSSLHLDGIVAGVEDEQGSCPLRGRPAQERFHLLGGHLALASRAGRTRRRSTGAVQLSRAR